MKRVFAATGIILALAFVTVLIIQNFTEAQPPAPPRAERGTGMRMPAGGFGAMIGQVLSLPASWWHVSMEIGISDEQLLKARPIYREAWKKQQDLRKERPQNREEMQARLASAKELNTELGEKLKEILTEKQFSQYEEWEKKRQERLERSRERLQQRQQQRPNRQQRRSRQPQPE